MRNDRLEVEYENYLRRATDNNEAYAMYNIGIMHFTGELGEVNFEEAAKWYEKAANLGLAQAQYNLGTMYDRGQGVKQDFERAMELYQLAAKKGDSKAKHSIGSLYENGEGVEKNIEEAKKWFAEACLDGEDFSCQCLNRISSHEEIRKIQDLRYLRELGNRGALDGKSIKQIKEYLKNKGIKESFAVWKELRNGYIGVALEDMAYKAYDFAQTVEDLEEIEYFSIDNDFQSLVREGIDNLKKGRTKPKYQVARANGILEDNIIKTLDLIDFELNGIEYNWDYMKNSQNISDLNFILAGSLQGIIVRYEESLTSDKNKKAVSVIEKIRNAVQASYNTP